MSRTLARTGRSNLPDDAVTTQRAIGATWNPRSRPMATINRRNMSDALLVLMSLESRS